MENCSVACPGIRKGGGGQKSERLFLAKLGRKLNNNDNELLQKKAAKAEESEES